MYNTYWGLATQKYFYSIVKPFWVHVMTMHPEEQGTVLVENTLEHVMTMHPEEQRTVLVENTLENVMTMHPEEQGQ
jgi:hypothetical protein